MDENLERASIAAAQRFGLKAKDARMKEAQRRMNEHRNSESEIV